LSMCCNEPSISTKASTPDANSARTGEAERSRATSPASELAGQQVPGLSRDFDDK